MARMTPHFRLARFARHSRFLTVAALAGCLPALLTGCRQADDEGPQGVKMGLVLADASSPYGQAIQRGANVVAQKHHVEIVLKDAKGNPQTQAAELESLQGGGVGVILLEPVDPAAMQASAKKVVDAKTYLVTLDRTIPNTDISTQVEFDPQLAGQLAADFCRFRLSSGGMVALLKGAGTPGEGERLKALRAYLKEKAPKIQVAGEVSATDAGAARTAAERLLASHPDLAALYADSDAYALAAVEAVRSHASGGPAPFVIGYGGGDAAVTELKKADSPLQLTLATVPMRLGRVSAQSGWNIVSNKAAASRAGLVVLPVTRETAGAYPGWAGDLPKKPDVPWPSELRLEGKRE